METAATPVLHAELELCAIALGRVGLLIQAGIPAVGAHGRLRSELVRALSMLRGVVGSRQATASAHPVDKSAMQDATRVIHNPMRMHHVAVPVAQNKRQPTAEGGECDEQSQERAML